MPVLIDRFSLESEAVRCRLTAVASPARNPGTAAFDAKEFALDQKGPLHFFEFLATGRKAPQNCLSHSFRGSGPENPELEHVKTQDWFIQVASGEVGSEGFQVLVLAYGSCKTAASIWQLSLRNLFSLPCNTDSISGCLMGRRSLCADKVDACFAVITQFFLRIPCDGSGIGPCVADRSRLYSKCKPSTITLDLLLLL